MSDQLNVYSVKDKKTGRFLSLELFVNDLEVERFLLNSLKHNKQGLLAQFPDDYELYRLGSFNACKGIENVFDPVFVCGINEIFTPSPSGNEDK